MDPNLPSPHITISAGPTAAMMSSPALSTADSMRSPTPAGSKPSTPASPMTLIAAASVFACVAVQDPLRIPSSQTQTQAQTPRRSPYDQCLMLPSRDGYCTPIILDEILPAYHTRQHILQLHSSAHTIRLLGSLRFVAFDDAAWDSPSPSRSRNDRKSRPVFIEAISSVTAGKAEPIAGDWTAKAGEGGTGREYSLCLAV
ncbi:hypothetical protein BD310DRAFT_952347 [Dichomitus squalens]|uniref:Uncharacterized protein n=1 Tax=Dichomitus squalens TaxID=114155 RepID=A0A4Q9PDZ7_9APHY|nr:hypothetical protein BD310DRAFT_952347 [Dichomitus squalens]